MKIVKSIPKILGYILIILLIFITVTLIIEKNVLKKDLPSIFGYSLLEIQSNSMSPDIIKGNYIIIKNQNNYAVGDIVTFKEEDVYVTHKIISIVGSTITTQGIANNKADPSFDISNIAGKVRIIVPLAKNVLFWFMLMIILIIALVSYIFEKDNSPKGALAVSSIIIIAFFGATGTYSSYKNSVSVNGQVEAAEFITESNIQNTISFYLEDMEPGVNRSYTFYVRNYKNNKRTEVTTNYTIKLDSSNNIPVTYALYKNSVATNILDSNLTASIQTMEFDANQSDSYELVISWDPIVGEEEYANLVDYVDVIITSNQVIDLSS